MGRHRWSLRGKLVFTGFLIALTVAVISYSVYAYTVQKMARGTVLENLQSLQLAVEDNLSTDLAAINRAAKNIVVGNSVYRYLQNGAPNLNGDELAQSVLRTGIEKDMAYDLLFDSAFSEGLIESIYLYLSDDNVAFLSRSNRSTDKNLPSVKAVYAQIRGERFWGQRSYPSPAEDDLVYFAYCLYPISADSTVRNLYLILSTAKAKLDNHFAPLQNNDGAVYYVLDPENQVLVSSLPDTEGKPADASITALGNTQGVLREGTYRGTGYYLSVRNLDNGFRSVTMLPVSRLTVGVTNATWSYLFLCLGILGATILLVLPLALNLTRFTNDFVTGIRRFAGGDFTVKLPAYQDHDLAEISHTFNQMTEEIDTLIKERYEKQMLLQQMDIAFLQSQMNPHFLFNVLLTISARAKMDHDEPLFEMVQSLTTLIQASQHQKQAVKIPLCQELKYVHAYLNIQRLRFGNRIRFEIDVPEALQPLLIPRLSIQPLVENAVVHGLSPQEEGGLVRVTARSDGQALTITVEDDGCGFDPQAPAQEAPPGAEHNHLALINLKKRIELIYGGDFTLQLHTAPEEGCRVTLHLPVEEAEHEVPSNPC